MKHTINNTEVEIDWDKVFLVENHESGCKEYAVMGIGDNKVAYSGNATFQDEELIEVINIEEI